MALSENEVKALRNKRGLIKGQITRLVTFLDDFERKEPKDYIYLETKVEQSVQKCENFDNIQFEIETNTDEPNLEKEYTDRFNFEDKCIYKC